MLVIVQTAEEAAIRALWGKQINELRIDEDKNVVWNKSKGPMSSDVFTFTTKLIEPFMLNMTIPLYVKLSERDDRNEYMIVGGKPVRAHVVVPRRKGRELVDWLSVHDAWIEKCDAARRSGGEVLRQFAFGLNLPMNGSEIESVWMKSMLGFKNELNGIRPPFHSLVVNDGIVSLPRLKMFCGSDEAMTSIPNDKRGDEKLFRLLEATWEPNEYLIYVGAAPGHSIQRFLRKCKSPRYATFIDPRHINIDARTFGSGEQTIEIITGEDGYASGVLIAELVTEWKNKENKKTDRIYILSDIRREKTEATDRDEWVDLVNCDEEIQKDFVEVARAYNVPFKYMLKKRIPDVDDDRDITLYDKNCFLFRAAYSRPDLYELREYCPIAGGEDVEISVTRDQAISLHVDGTRNNFSREQHVGLMSLQINDRLTHDKFVPSVDLFYLTNKRNAWTYESFLAKAQTSAVATWWVSDTIPEGYDDVPIPSSWFTRISDEVYDVSVFDGDLFTLAVQSYRGQMNKTVDYEWQSHFVVTVNRNLLAKSDPVFTKEIEYSTDAYFSQSRGLRDGANSYKRFDPKYAAKFTHLKGWSMLHHKRDLSGHLRMMVLDGVVRNYDMARWIRQVYASNVMNSAPDLDSWDLMDPKRAMEAQKRAQPYEAKGIGKIWHTRDDLVWTLAALEVMLDGVSDVERKAYIPRGIVLQQLKTSRNEIDRIKGLFPN
uniref:VP4 n=1 Tax=viral metagenome TaxID=1070528 RepID=A0A2V0RAT1_9ZZZZ